MPYSPSTSPSVHPQQGPQSPISSSTPPQPTLCLHLRFSDLNWTEEKTEVPDGPSRQEWEEQEGSGLVGRRRRDRDDGQDGSETLSDGGGPRGQEWKRGVRGER